MASIGMRALTLFAFSYLTLAQISATPLVKNGKPVGEFVIAPNDSQAETFATTDVCDWIEKITGARIPIVNKAGDTTGVKVFVGTQFAAAYPDDLERLKGNDGFAVREKDGNVYVFGSRPRGTIYGMYEFLQRNTDLIFSRPHDDFGTVFGKTSDLNLTETDFIEIPVFLNRRFGPGWPAHRGTGLWLLRNRDNTRDVRANYDGFLDLDQIEPFGTNFAVPIDKYAEEHPEYFGYNPITKSRRFVKHGEGTMCLTVPGLPAIWARGLAEKVAAHEKRWGRKVEHVRLGPGDNWFCCQCDKCVAPLHLPDGSTLECKDPDSIKDPLFRSTQIMMFINEAMDTWKTLRPEIPIHVLAYIHFAEPPKVAVHPDLGIWYAPYPTNNMHYPLLDPRQPEPWGRRFKQWLTMNDRLGFYEYFDAKPSPEGYYAAANLREVIKLPDHKNALIYTEMTNDFGTGGIGNGALGWDVAQMNYWVLIRLFWDPTQDVDELYHYYIDRTYREAAPQMQAYFELIKSSWMDPENTTVTACHASIAGVYKGMIIDQGLEKECLRLLKEGEAAAKHPESKIMIRRMREQYEGFSKDLVRLTVANIDEIRGQSGDFDSIQWEKPDVCDDFKLTSRDGNSIDAPYQTKLQAVRDGNKFVLRFQMEAPSASSENALPPRPDKEIWPEGDHVEFWLLRGNDQYVFSFNSKGTKYDAKNLDRNWDSQWDLKVRESEEGWEAIASIPLSTFDFKSGEESAFKWSCHREVKLPDQESTHISYQGHPLYYRKFPILIE